jgi:hypothetical protein
MPITECMEIFKQLKYKRINYQVLETENDTMAGNCVLKKGSLS